MIPLAFWPTYEYTNEPVKPADWITIPFGMISHHGIVCNITSKAGGGYDVYIAHNTKDGGVFYMG
jgi:hypothetical protein